MAERNIVSSPVRVAMREELGYWVAYIAPRNTMDGAEEIGRCPIWIAGKEGPRRAFMEFAKSCLADLMKDIGANVEGFEEMPAPDHERGGHG